MKAVVMAGGNGSRLRPMLAESINKHLCPVGGKPLIHWPLETLANMGISQVFVMGNGPKFLPVMEEVGIGKKFGLQVSYLYEPVTAGQSVGSHLRDVEPYLDNEPFVLMLGDSVYLEPPPKPNGHPFQTWAMPINTAWDDISKYAMVPGEKELMQTGAWVMPPAVFQALEKLEQHKSTIRIRDAVTALCGAGANLSITQIKPDSFIDCGTPEAVNTINQRFL